MTLHKALFLDRDGVINIDHGYVHKREDFVFVEGIRELVKTAQSKGYQVLIVTNQSGIGRGYYSEEAFTELMDWLRHEMPYDAYYYCPYHPEHGLGDYKRDSEDRKPNPGMILRAAAEHGVDLARSLLIGDGETDIEAAKKAGIGTSILFHAHPETTAADAIITHLNEAAKYL